MMFVVLIALAGHFTSIVTAVEKQQKGNKTRSKYKYALQYVNKYIQFKVP